MNEKPILSRVDFGNGVHYEVRFKRRLIGTVRKRDVPFSSIKWAAFLAGGKQAGRLVCEAATRKECVDSLVARTVKSKAASRKSETPAKPDVYRTGRGEAPVRPEIIGGGTWSPTFSAVTNAFVNAFRDFAQKYSGEDPDMENLSFKGNFSDGACVVEIWEL